MFYPLLSLPQSYGSGSFALLLFKFYDYIALYKAAQLCSHFAIAGIIFMLILGDYLLLKYL